MMPASGWQLTHRRTSSIVATAMSPRQIAISLLISGVIAGCGYPSLPSFKLDGSVSEMDAASDAPIDAAPDAAPVACSGDNDCQTPPNLCELPGTCDLSMHKCVFLPKDCSTQNTCGTFGSCGGANPQDACDSGTRSRTC